eukprot:COSAG02_NODE_3149_length_7284_cov_3.179262_8_plen_84_part_00
MTGVPMVNATQRVDWTRVAAYELYNLDGDTGSDFDFDGGLLISCSCTHTTTCHGTPPPWDCGRSCGPPAVFLSPTEDIVIGIP